MSKMYSSRAVVIILVIALVSVIFAVKQFFRLRTIVYNETLQESLVK